jgi:hypothetical protein
MMPAHAAYLAVTKLFTVVVLILLTTGSYAEESDFESGGEIAGESGGEKLVEFYLQKYLEKAQTNDQLALALAQKTKKQIASAMRTMNSKKISFYQNFLNRLQETVVDSRKSSARDCSRLAGKFSNLKVRSSTAANCRTDRELQLERHLQALEIEFKRLPN